MPSEAYQFLTDAETAALIAYIRSLPAKAPDRPERSIGPLGRLGVATGKFERTPQLVAAYRRRAAGRPGPAHRRRAGTSR